MKDVIDAELSAMSDRIKEFSGWLEEQFDANCAEDDYTDGCLSCEAGMARKYLGHILKLLAPQPNVDEGDGK